MIRFHQWIVATLVVAVFVCIAAPLLASETKGTIASVQPDRNEFVLTECFKDLKFLLAPDAKVLINGQGSKLADVRAGDAATVVFERQGQLLLAMVVRVSRKENGPAQSDMTPALALPRWETRVAAGTSK